MRSIDIHAHLMPHGMLQTLYRGDTWHGVSGERNAQGRLVYGVGERRQALSPPFAWNTAQRLADMDARCERSEGLYCCATRPAQVAEGIAKGRIPVRAGSATGA